MQLCSSKLITDFKIWKSKLFPCGIIFLGKLKKLWKSPRKVLILCVCYVRKLSKTQITMSRLTVPQRIWVCIEFARLLMLEMLEVKRRLRNCWQYINKKKKFQKNNKIVFFVIHFIFLIAWLLKEICSLFSIIFRNFDI